MRIRLARVAPERGIFPPLPASPNREELKAKGSALAETQADTERLETAGLAELITRLSQNSKRVDTLIRETQALSNSAWETHDLQEIARLRPEVQRRKGEWQNTFSDVVRDIQRLEIVLLRLPSPLDAIGQRIEAIDFGPPKGYCQEEGIVRGLAQLQLLLDAIPACVGVLMTAQPVGMPLSTRTSKRRTAPGMRRRSDRVPNKNLLPSQLRANMVAKVIHELDVLKPKISGMVSDEDLLKIARKHPRFLTFRISRQYPDLMEKIRNIQFSRRHIRLAQEIVAVKSGRTWWTVQTDWQHHMPNERRQRNR